jgi:hypothetical protein
LLDRTAGGGCPHMSILRETASDFGLESKIESQELAGESEFRGLKFEV